MGDERPVMEGPGHRAAPSPGGGGKSLRGIPREGAAVAILCSSAVSGDQGGGALLGSPTPLVPFKTPTCPAGQCRPQPWPLTLPGASRILTPPGPSPCLWSRGAVLTDGETK